MSSLKYGRAMTIPWPCRIGAPLDASRHHFDTTFDDVVVVDSRDAAVGTMSKLEAHTSGLRHRAISIIICDRRNRVLLQRRAFGKYHSAGLWTNTCCTHPRPGEAVLDAAGRRLHDEMGIRCRLTPLFRMHYRARVSDRMIENEITHVFGGCFEGSPAPNPHEAGAWRWISVENLAHDIDLNSERFTIWFQYMRRRHWPKIVAFAAAMQESAADVVT